ncbi:MAG: DUF3999 family protein [Calditrichaceae bacterium]|nr:DUF3999 family protein [Calditrichaceae bacterium]MBN2708715.1 DUF3999 family protein [Calditrichaceae bacterium]RQV92827.1 MAG: DUF3999 family protein [Calditrichota bacterium]
MMKKPVSCLMAVIFLSFTFVFGQYEDYSYRRNIEGIGNEWHRILLPNDLLRKASEDLSDIRILAITENSDTVEAPYLLKITEDVIQNTDIPFSIINRSKKNGEYFYTFEISSQKPVNRIELNFAETNFDRMITLEGSHDQAEWFTILENYRILSIRNELTDYKFCTLSFPEVQYRYLRLHFRSADKPQLNSAVISEQKVTEGLYQSFNVVAIETNQDREAKQTIVKADLGEYVPVSRLKIFVKNDYDYYRPVTIKYLADSSQTPKGWKYYYRTITSGYLSSLEENIFKFNSKQLSKLEILVSNYDNAPLIVDSVQVRGNYFQLTARFPQAEKYYLLYGNHDTRPPVYDIGYFKDKIPADLTSLSLGDEQKLVKGALVEPEPLFKNPLWLWAIIILIIVILGWFTLKMLYQK